MAVTLGVGGVTTITAVAGGVTVVTARVGGGTAVTMGAEGHVAYHLTTFFRDHDRRALLRLTVELPRWHLRSITRWLRGTRKYPLSLIIVEILGNLVGPFALWRSRCRVKREGSSKL